MSHLVEGSTYGVLAHYSVIWRVGQVGGEEGREEGWLHHLAPDEGDPPERHLEGPQVAVVRVGDLRRVQGLVLHYNILH